jgi:DNA-binding NtrC family response regulator
VGTGKQQVAQLLYRWSGRPESDLHTWDAAQIGSVDTTRRLQTFLSDQTREARVELTPPSTLLLENLQLLSPEMRDRLYRFIARASRRQLVNGPWQMIATAQQASKGAVGLKALLEQLQFPNESFVFQLPPLREHIEDLPSIVDLLITQLRQRHAKPVFGVDTQAMRCLQAHTWPDNIRELRQVIEHAVMRCETLYIGKLDLPGYLQHGRPVSADTTRLH